MAKTISEALAYVQQKMSNSPVKDKDFTDSLELLSDAIRAADEYFHTECKTLSTRDNTLIKGFSDRYEALRKEVMDLERLLMSEGKRDSRGAKNILSKCNAHLVVLQSLAKSIMNNL